MVDRVGHGARGYIEDLPLFLDSPVKALLTYASSGSGQCHSHLRLNPAALLQSSRRSDYLRASIR